VAAQYLPEDRDAVVVDLASGAGDFADHLGLADRYANLHLLDFNPTIVEKLRKRLPHAMVYRAPKRMPFEDATVNYLNCSHMIEHLKHEDLLDLIREMDRVLCPGGALVTHSPLPGGGFYGDVDHVKPYEPRIFLDHLCSQDVTDPEAMPEGAYELVELVHGYGSPPVDEGLGASCFCVDLLLRAGRRLLRALGVRKHVRTGYTLALRKVS